MSQSDGYPEGDAATLIDARHKPLVSRRRIEHLKALAYDCGLTAEEARKYGKLTATKTWESLLSAHGLEFDRKSQSPDTASPSHETARQINLTDWIDWSQALALALASVGFALLILGMFPRINPLNLFPVKITIQVGK
ncbi:hypothetical protein AVDCRST_MAG94-4400 [uncultured Leptolyngbya sp.]|uniref:Uncharacterized protein n=1 Tax=uncultured Leptolyngbya sp. TaxID=332963 RepID=A0A6J4N1Y5_9CYAN|nr:hypothetical protein AVDCRST_MAG94-4400 [uncultured Leptolyngbya sp.]